jgi:hypothetical protein
MDQHRRRKQLARTRRLGAAPHAVAADGAATRIAVVTEDDLLESTDGGQTFRVLLAH